MAEYRVDGKRLGEIDWKTRSGAPDDPELAQTDSEILTAALTLAHLNRENVVITAHGADGRPLEKPDLDVIVDGVTVGIEVAEVPGAAKHEALKNRVELQIASLLQGDPGFRLAFGNHYLAVNLNPIASSLHVPIEGAREVASLVKDIEAFVRTGLSVPNDGLHLRPFPPRYTALAARKCEYHIADLPSGPYFDLSDGPGPMSSSVRIADVITVLDKHRRSATTNYRALPEMWMILFLPDADEYFRRTIEAVRRQGPAITPFSRCFAADTSGLMPTVVEIVPTNAP